MNIANGKICPNCAELIPSTEDSTHLCETPESEYSIIPDGEGYGIAFGPETKIHGLSLESAKRILALLNWNEEQKKLNYGW